MSLSSVNFGFMSQHDEALVAFAGAAEANVTHDPNTSLIKTRQFAEFLAKLVSAHAGLSLEADDFSSVLHQLRRNRIVARDIAEHFDLLRLRGNQAVHAGLRDPLIAFQALMTAYELAKWFHRNATGDLGFSPGPFRPPPTPAKVERQLREELEVAWQEVAEFRERAANAEGRALQLEDIKRRTEQEVAEQYSVAFSQYVDAFQQSQAEQSLQIQLLQNRLAQMAATVVSHPKQLGSFFDRTKDAARRLKLVGEAAEYLPLAQLRIKGPRLSRCHQAPTLLVQSSKGGMVSANCSKCNRSETVTKSEFMSLNLWVSCPRCRTQMDPDIVTSNYGFVCSKCRWCCFLSSLVPHYTEIT